MDANVDVRNEAYPEAVGQLHWIASQSRPDLCFDVLDLATVCEVSDIKLKSKINKDVRKARNNQYKILYPSLESSNFSFSAMHHMQTRQIDTKVLAEI